MSESFLIIRLGSLGDVIHAIPAAAALRARYPGARIDWAVDPRYVAVLDLVRGLDARIPLDPRWPVSKVLATIRQLRAANYDAAIDLQGLLKSAAIARAAGARRTIGFGRAQLREPMARVLYTESAPPAAGPHVIDKNLAALEPLQVRGAAIEFPLEVPKTPAVRVVEETFGADGYAVLNPGAAWPNKQWPPGRFGALAAALRDRIGVRSLVLWGPGEEPIAAAVVAAARGAAMASPPTTVVDLFGIAQRARVAVSGDTGPLHIAGAVGTPLVALFGPTDAARNGPWSTSDVVISRQHTCECHYERRCRRAAACIDDITIEEVAAAVTRRVGAC